MRLKVLIVMMLALFLLSACHHTVQPVTTPEVVDRPQTLSVQQIVKQALQALNTVDSFSLIVETTRTTSSPNEESDETTSSKSELVITKDPLAMHQKIAMTTNPSELVETELYFVDDQFYFKDAIESRWFTYPNDLIEEFVDIETMETRGAEQLTILKEYEDIVSVHEKEDTFVLTVSGNSSDLLGLIQAVSSTINDRVDEEMSQLLSMATVVDFSYELCIDKQTFLQKEMNMDVTLQLIVDKEKVIIDKKAKAEIKDVNEITSITIPTPIIEQAEPFSLHRSEVEEIMQEDES